MEKQQAYRTLFTMMVVVLFSCAGIALPYPVLAPLFLNEVTPLTTFADLPPKLLLGLVLAIYPLGVLIGSSFIGACSDVYGRKKVLLVSLGASIVGYMLTAWALIAENYLLFLLTRFLTGVCEGNISIAKAVALNLSPTLDKTRTFSLINATGYTGWLLGPLAGGFLQPFGSDVVFFVAAVAMFSAVLSVIFLFKDDKQDAAKRSFNFKSLLKEQNSFSLLSNKTIRHHFFIYLIATLGLNAYYEFYPLWLVEAFDFTSPEIGTITALITAVMVMTSTLFITKIKAKLGLKKGIVLGMLSLGLCFCLHPAVSEHMLWWGYAFIGVAIAIYNGLLPVYISECHENEGQGKLMGLLTTTFSLSNVIIAIIGSFIALIGSVWSIIFGGVLFIIAAIYFLLNDGTKNNHREDDKADKIEC